MSLTFQQIEKLWIKAGGADWAAPLMAAIALAESSGHTHALNDNPNTKDYSVGLWQINYFGNLLAERSQRYGNPDKLRKNALLQAKAAVNLFQGGRGLSNWQNDAAYSAYQSGGMQGVHHWLKSNGYLSQGSSFDPMDSGVLNKDNFAGVDQGVDFTGSGKVPVLDNAIVTDVGSSPIIERQNQSFPWVVYQLTAGPYKGEYVYVAENWKPTVRVGDRLKKGQSLGVALGQYPYIEYGFNKSAKGWNPVAPLTPDPHGAKPAGQKMWAYIQGQTGGAEGGGGQGPKQKETAAGTDVGGNGWGPSIFDMPDNASGVQPADVMQTANISTPFHVSNAWNSIASQANASPETRLLAQNAKDYANQ